MIHVTGVQLIPTEDRKLIGRFEVYTSEFKVRAGFKVTDKGIEIIFPKGVTPRPPADREIVKQLRDDIERKLRWGDF